MAKKSMKEAATAGTSVFDTIASRNVINVKDVQRVQDTKNAKDAPESTEKVPMERLNLKIPTDIKEYLTIAAAKASIEQRRHISLTQYLCDLVAADRAQHDE